MVTPNSSEQQPGTNAAGTPNGQGQVPPTGTPAPQAGASGTQPAQGQTIPIHVLHEERDKRQALQAEVEQLRGIMSRMQQQPPIQSPYQPPQYGYQPPPVQQPPIQQQLEELWQADPQRAMRTELSAFAQWIDYTDNQVDESIEKAKSTYADFSNYEGGIRRYVKQLPREQRANPSVVDAAYYIVKGQNTDKLLQAREQEILEKIKRGEAVQGMQGYSGSSTPSNQPSFNEEEKRVAEAMGVSPEEYIKYRRAGK